MAPRLIQPTATANKLVDVMTLNGEQPTNGKGKTGPFFTSLSYFPDGKQMVAGSTDNSARRWDLQTGKEIKDTQVVCEWGVRAVAVSRDSRWVITGGGDHDHLDRGELKAWEVETGMMKTFEGHSKMVTCIDVSIDNTLLASGSCDHKARIWDFNTGKLVAGPFECVDSWVGTVRFSQDSKKLAVKSGYYGTCLEVWDIQEQKLNRRVGHAGNFPDTTVLVWTTKDRSIVSAFRFQDDFEKKYEFDASTLETVGGLFEGHTTIYELDASTLKTVGAPFEHARAITGLALSFDCALLASASSFENTIKLWAFESRQLLASFDAHNPSILTLSPNSRQLAYATSYPPRIHIRDIPRDILARIWPEQATCSVCIFTTYIHPLSTNSSCRPLRLNIRTPLTNSMYVILFSHPLRRPLLYHSLFSIIAV